MDNPARSKREEFEREWNLALAGMEEMNSDVLLFSAEINNATADRVIRSLHRKVDRRPRLAFILTTYGGSPHAAFRIARALRSSYDQFALYVFGVCKSAGTLIALSADEIVMSDYGELGPLDIQVRKADELFFLSSGLDVEEAMHKIGAEAYVLFEKYLGDILKLGETAITLKTASEIASSMSVGLFAPLMRQIDPLRVGENARQMRIVQEYGKRLCSRSSEEDTHVQQKRAKALSTLSENYPSHGFVIDREEASKLFDNVRIPNTQEKRLAETLHSLVRNPHKSNLVEFLDPFPGPDSDELTAIEGDTHGNNHTSDRQATEGEVQRSNGQGKKVPAKKRTAPERAKTN